jgi:hypothetical protein
VASNHHDLVGLGRAGNFADHIETHLIILLVFGLDVEGQLRCDAMQEERQMRLYCSGVMAAIGGPTGSLGSCDPP